MSHIGEMKGGLRELGEASTFAVSKLLVCEYVQHVFWFGWLVGWFVCFFFPCRCNHWRAHIVHNHSSYYLDYYFSVSDWKTTWKNSSVVRAVINGTRSATTNFSAHAFYHVYDFIDFHPGPPDPSNFQLPDGYYCLGLKGENKTVPQVPSNFSMEFETVWSRNNSNYTVSNWKVGTVCNMLIKLHHGDHHHHYFSNETFI